MTALEKVADDLSAAAAHLGEHIDSEHPWHSSRHRTPPHLAELWRAIGHARRLAETAREARVPS